MPTDKKQAKTPEQLMNIISQLQAILEKNVTKQELFELGNALASLIKELQKHVDVKITENKELLTSETSRLGREVSEFEKRLRGVIEQTNKTTDTKLRNELETKIKELSTLVGYVEDKIQIYNDAEIRELIEEVYKNLPEEYDDSKMMEHMEDHEKRISDLEKRPTTIAKTNGGVTDKSIQYALMRSIQSVTPTGTIDGANTDFEVPSTIHAVLSFELNSRVVALGEYSIIGGARKIIRFDTAIPASYSGKSFVITYL